MNSETSFGRWIHQRRKALDLTQEALADRVGCSVSAIRKIENDERRPSRQIASLLAEILEIPAEEREVFIKVARAEARLEQLDQHTFTSQPSDALIHQVPEAGTTNSVAPFKSEEAVLAHSTRLPAPPTPFIGRQAEMATISALLENEQCRLLTITGPGGIGKTRLAIQAASHRRGNFAEGVYFISLGLSNSAEFIIPAIADGLAFPFSGIKEPKIQLLDYLREKEMLLVLDNLEHLVSEAAILAEILQHAPKVKLLVTSRERLNLQGEWVVEISGLPSPPLDFEDKETSHISSLILQEYDAATLFENSARRVRPNFKIDSRNQSAVVRICYLMEGNPLGIEMAAAWVRVLSCQEIATEIERSYDFLEISFRDTPERHRSLRAAFDHSWKLLSPEERNALRRISVFRVGFNRQAAIEVTAVSLTTLSALLDKSLLRLTTTRRYEQHELVQQYASEKLQVDAADYTEVHARHCEYYLRFLKERADRIFRDRTAVEEIRIELENVRSAWQWALVINNTAALQQGIKGLAGFFHQAGLLREGEKVFTEAVQWAQTSNPDRHADLLSQLLASLAGFLNDRAKYIQAIETAQQAAALAHKVNDPETEALANLEWGQALRRQDAYYTARQHINIALSLARANNLIWLEAKSLNMLGNVALFQRDFPEALIYQEQSLQLFVQSGDRFGESAVLNSLGIHFYLNGNFAKAQEYYETALGIFRETGNRRGESHALNNLGGVSEAQGHYLTAKDYYQRSLAIVTEIGDQDGECISIANVAHASYLLGDFEQSIVENERVIAIARAIQQWSLEAISLSNLGLISFQRGNFQAAMDYQHQAQQALQKQEIPRVLSYIRFREGRIFFSLNMFDEACAAYQEALDLRRELDHPSLILETLAGLVELSSVHAESAQFASQVERIWASLAIPESDILNETDDPFWLYLTCYRSFSARQDPRASEVLSGAHEQQSRLADQVHSEKEREIFLNSFSSQREISRAWVAEGQLH